MNLNQLESLSMTLHFYLQNKDRILKLQGPKTRQNGSTKPKNGLRESPKMAQSTCKGMLQHSSCLHLLDQQQAFTKALANFT